MGKRTDRDTMETDPPLPTAPRGPEGSVAILPTVEPAPASVGQQLAAIRERIAQLEDTFRYMGTGHPHYESTRTHIAVLRRMLQEVESVLGPDGGDGDG